MKTYVLLVSRTYPKGHKREGEPTYFVEKILNNGDILPTSDALIERKWKIVGFINKFHTCRRNYELWAKRIKEVQEGKAILSLRYWQDERGRSVKGNEQVEFARLGKDSGVGVQKLSFDEGSLMQTYANINNDYNVNIWNLAKNDGLSIEDFKDWFKNYDLSKPMAIIHFTSFRY